MKRPNFKVGDKVFAKVKGYPPWPARIVGENGKKYNVEFYGTGETGSIKSEDLFYYIKNKEKFQKPLKRKDYIDAFEQIEEAIKNDGGDGDQAPDVNDSLANESLNLSSGNNSKIEKTDKKAPAKRKRPLPEEVPAETSTPKKKSARLSKTEEVQKPEETEKTDDLLVANKTKTPKVVKKDKDKTEAKETQPDENKDEDSQSEEKKSSDDVKVSEIKNKSEEAMEEEDKPGEKKLHIDIISEKGLQHNISYAEYVKKSEKIYKDKPLEPRQDHENQVLPIKLVSGKMGGIKLHLKWPIECDDEYTRAIYDETVAKRVLESKQKMEEGDLSIIEDAEKFITDIELTEEGVKHMFSLQELQHKQEKMARMNTEAELLGLNVKIKNCLGLDKADPKEAIGYLEEMCKLSFDDIVLKKHFHIIEMVRRLRKYVGNTREWKMNDETLNEFTKQAERVREMAEEVYAKFKSVVKLPENCTSFFEGFTELVTQFRADCKELDISENEIFALGAEPRSRRAFLARLEDKQTDKEIKTDSAVSEPEKPFNGNDEEKEETV